MLYLVATPIGNLKDLSDRARETLSSADLILCEDTRHSRPLLEKHGIDRPLKSLHKFNEASQIDPLLNELKTGKTIALISDAGTPGISDPGEILVKRCQEAGIVVSAIPGACALVTALSVSGFSTCPFQFVGFLPKKGGELKRMLVNCLTYLGTSVAYESPQRLIKTLQMVAELTPERSVGMARELTKKFEEVRVGTAAELISGGPYKGEIVLIFEGKSSEQWKELSPADHVQQLMDDYDLTKMEATKLAANLRGVPKREIYGA